MFQVLKRQRRDANGKVVNSRYYYIRYRIEPMPVAVFKSLRVTDKSVAESLARDFYIREQRIQAGIELPRDTQKLKDLPLSKLCDLFIDELKVKKRSNRYIQDSKNKFVRILKLTGWNRLTEITAESFQDWRKSQFHLSPKSLNDYRSLLLQFMEWNRFGKRISENPITFVQKVTKSTSPRQRRAINLEALNRLIAVQPERGLKYFFAAFTGLRKNEMRLLEWRDIDFKNSAIRLRGAITKNSRNAVLPLFSELKTSLLKHYSEQDSPSPVSKVFDSLPKPETFKRDLVKAKIDRIDELGRHFDFHALRVTFNTFLQNAGVSLRVAQTLMRHSDPKLTANIYTDENLLPTRAAVESLPHFELSAHIDAQKTDIMSQNLSCSVANDTNSTKPVSPCSDEDCQTLSHSDAINKMVGTTGFEPVNLTPVNPLSIRKNKQGQLESAQIDAQILDESSQILSTIVESWEGLSMDTKLALFAIVNMAVKQTANIET